MTLTRTRAWVAVAAFLAVAVAAWVVVWLLTPGDETPVRTSFRDAHGRVCTQVVWRDTVALSCEFKGLGAALGGWLDTPRTPPTFEPVPAPTPSVTVQPIPNWK